MSQRDCLDWLRKHPGWHRTAELCEVFDVSLTNIRDNLRKLVRQGELDVREVDRFKEYKAINAGER